MNVIKMLYGVINVNFFFFFQNFGPHGKYARKLRLERRLEKKVKHEMEQKELTSE